MDKTTDFSSLIYKLMLFFLFYISLERTMTIFFDNLFISSIKDVLLLLVITAGVCFVLLRLCMKDISYLLFTLISLAIIGTLGVLLSSDWVSWVYGMKITILPFFLIFLGIYLKKFKYQLSNFFVFIYILITLLWTIQYFIGVEKLVEMGFVYGINIKTFSPELPRLPSSLGTPENYAFTLVIVAAILEEIKFRGKSPKIKSAFKAITLFFLIMSTVRSAMLFWLVFQMITAVVSVKDLQVSDAYKKLAYFFTSILFMVAAGIYFFLFSTVKIDLLSYRSLLVRFEHWGSYVPSLADFNGWIGNGLGSIGAASRRVYDLGYHSANYAVDNQFIGIYQQVGLIGSVLFILFLFQLTTLLFSENKEVKKYSLAIFCAAMASSMFSTTFEIFPFNMILWLYLGMSLALKRKTIAREEQWQSPHLVPYRRQPE